MASTNLPKEHNRPAVPVSIGVYVGIVGSLALTGMIAFDKYPLFLESFIKFVEHYSLMLYRSKDVIKLVFIAAMIAHTVEPIYAYYLARKLGYNQHNSKIWALQALFVGIFSLKNLLKESKKQNSRKE